MGSFDRLGDEVALRHSESIEADVPTCRYEDRNMLKLYANVEPAYRPMIEGMSISISSIEVKHKLLSGSIFENVARIQACGRELRYYNFQMSES